MVLHLLQAPPLFLHVVVQLIVLEVDSRTRSEVFESIRDVGIYEDTVVPSYDLAWILAFLVDLELAIVRLFFPCLKQLVGLPHVPMCLY